MHIAGGSSPLNRLRSLSKQNRLNRLEKNRGIECQILVLDVIEIVLQFLPGIVDRCAVRILNLRPTSQPRRDQLPLFVVGELLRQLLNKVRTLRARTDKVHVTAQDVPELWDLIDPNLTNNTTDARHALVVCLSPNRPIFLGIDAHRTKFHHRKNAPLFANAFLPVENWPARFEFDQDCRDGSDRQRKNRSHKCDYTMHAGANKFIEAGPATAAGKDQPRWPNHVEQHTTGQSFVKGSAFFNRNLAREA